MLDITNIKPASKIDSFARRPKPKSNLQQKPQITKRAAEDIRDPEVEKVKEMESRRAGLFKQGAYDITDFGALNTDRGFVGNAQIADEIRAEREKAGEIVGEEEILD